MNNIEQEYSVPYFYESNDRIERLNRTIRDACKKNKGLLKNKLKIIVEGYNGTFHRAIGMKPKEALEKSKLEKVRENTSKYAKKFKVNKNKVVLLIGAQVLIKNKTKKNKMSKEFQDRGEIVKKIGVNTYMVLNLKGNRIKRHISQLREIKN